MARNTETLKHNKKFKTVEGIHFVREDAPDEVGRAIAEWLPHLTAH